MAKLTRDLPFHTWTDSWKTLKLHQFNLRNASSRRKCVLPGYMNAECLPFGCKNLFIFIRADLTFRHFCIPVCQERAQCPAFQPTQAGSLPNLTFSWFAMAVFEETTSIDQTLFSHTFLTHPLIFRLSDSTSNWPFPCWTNKQLRVAIS